MTLTYSGLVVCVLFLTNTFVESYRVLLVFPFPAQSHFILGNALARGLVEAGHDATIITAIEDKNPPRNKSGTYKEIVMTGFADEKSHMVGNMFDREGGWRVLQIAFVTGMAKTLVNKTMHHQNFKKLLESKDEQFDAVIVEQFLDDGLKILAHHFNAPLILFSPLETTGWVNKLVGNPSPPSYIADIVLAYSVPMTFFERVKNFLTRIYSDVFDEIYSYPAHDKIVKEAYPNSPGIEALLYNVSLVLLNSHESISQAVPHVPNMVDIGGFHIQPAKPLPKDLQQFMDNAKDGVVYFSMGSNLVPSMMPKESLRVLLKSLGEIKQKVLWKWDEENLPNKPDNVKISKWFPQRDILAHPNCRLFITHGGLLSTTETVYNGVPILAFPIFGDQKMNAARAQRSGYGKTLPFSKITEETLSSALKDLLETPRYRENAQKRSALMQDRLVKPMDSAIYWIEYVIRHKGAPHLRVAALDLPLYQYLLLDVIAFLIVVIVVSSFVFCLAVKKLCCTRKGNRDNKGKKVKRS